MVKWLLSIITILFFNLQSQAQFTSVSFSVQAHQDDWQLFMASRVIADMSVSGRKMVFITLTAGDESCGPCSYGAIPFYLGREKGSVNGAKFAADLTLGTTPLDIPTAGTASITGTTAHTITKYVYKNTVNYFLRLPDGDVNGAGFNNNNFQSLQRLKTNAITTISTIGVPSDPVAPTATYTWADLVATIRAIINAERISGTQTWINTAHTFDGSNSAYNPNDHSDHRYSSLAAQEAVASGMTWVGVNGFMDYNSSAFGSNLGETDHENATILFGLEVFGMTADGNYQNDFASNHQQWLPIDLNQIIKNPTVGSNAPFAGSSPEGFIPPSVSLTEIPMVVSVTSPAYINKDIRLFISPYEPGQLSTSVYDISGNKVFEQKTKVENRDGFFVTLKDAIKVQGTYIIKSILNDKFIETRKIVVQ